MPVDLREHADIGGAIQHNPLWPNCWKCSKAAGYPVNVVAYGVEDTGRTPGKEGVYYTDFFAECNHNSTTKEKDIIRIEGFRWNEWSKDGFSGDTIARLAAIKKLPFFYPGSEMGRCISKADYLNFLAGARGM